ncbi:MAG: hypothetical protein IKN85_13660 [Oscillospiraceae bacterium]|nr:hypothetical protein [Oscillospiraceae bacterium]MBR3536868.1 hypothetical protein [Oscillospiraceae bacterium]
MAERKSGAVEVFLTDELFNSLLSVLETYIKTEVESVYTEYALKLKNKIMNHTRIYMKNGEENAAIYFYEKEAAMLIKLFIMYDNAIENPSKNFFEIFKKTKSENDIIIHDNE